MLEKIRLFSFRQKLGVVIIGGVTLALPLFILATQRSTEYRQRASESTTPFFVLSPVTATKSTGENFTVQLMLTNAANVNGIDTTLTFDPQNLELVSFQPETGSSLNNVLLKTIDNQKGTLRYAAVNMSSKSTQGSIGTMTFRAKKESLASISFQKAKLTLQGQINAVTPTNNLSGIYTIASGNTATASATLGLVPGNATIPVGKPFLVDIYIHAGTNKITGASFTLTYNKLPLKSIDLSANPFNNLLKDTMGNGFYEFAAVDTIGKEITGSVKLGTLTFYPETPGTNTPVEFFNVQVTAQDKTGLVANTAFPNAGIYTVGETSVTPSGIPYTPTPTSTMPVSTYTPVVELTAAPTIWLVHGDVDGNGTVNILDYNIWRDEYLGKLTNKKADLNKDGKIDLADFNIWRNALVP